MLARDTWCRLCKARLATEVDHVLPKREGGPDSIENLQGLCKRCHGQKTAAGA